MDYKNILKQGEIFVKHHRFTSEKLRYIFLEGDSLCWGLPENQDSRNKLKGQIKIKDIINVQGGLGKSKGPKDEYRLDNIFTIYTDKRTLELEAKSQHVKLLWMNSILQLLKEK
ncbi:hypothetical protein pb186bvf_017855 [Paramecium bursaria]